MRVIEARKGRHTFERLWNGDKEHTYHTKIDPLIHGDRILFREYNPVSDFYSGRTLLCTVSGAEDHGEWMLIRFSHVQRESEGAERARSNYEELVFDI